jgi:RNA polymerase sigma-70 factor, ECF subfamily
VLVTEDPAQWFDRCAGPLRPALERHAIRLTHHHHDAEDLVQETMLKGYRAAGTFTRGTNFAAWIHRILLNTYISAYQQRQRRPQQLTANITDQQLTAGSRHSSAGLPSAEDEALNSMPNERIALAMETLNEQFRVAVYYADVEGYHLAEIAVLTEVPLGTVMSRLHRGRNQLRELLADTDRGQQVGLAEIG